jgi:hypothetical protein
MEKDHPVYRDLRIVPGPPPDAGIEAFEVTAEELVRKIARRGRIAKLSIEVLNILDAGIYGDERAMALEALDLSAHDIVEMQKWLVNHAKQVADDNARACAELGCLVWARVW